VSSIDRAFIFVSIGGIAIAIAGVAFLAGFDNTLTNDTSKKPGPVTQQEDETTVFQQGLSPQMKLNSNKLQPGVSSVIKIDPKEDIPIPLDATEVVFHKCFYHSDNIEAMLGVLIYCTARGITPDHNLVATINTVPSYNGYFHLEYAKPLQDRIELRIMRDGPVPLPNDFEISIIAFK